MTTNMHSNKPFEQKTCKTILFIVCKIIKRLRTNIANLMNSLLYPVKWDRAFDFNGLGGAVFDEIH